MTKAVFEERVKLEITEKEWELIEFVYTWHPSINEVFGKEQVAYLYMNFGMRIFHDMKLTATTAKALDDSIMRQEKILQDLEEQRTKLRTCEGGE